MRGLELKIWNVFAPASTARCTAVQHPPLVPTWTPIRFLAIPSGYRNLRPAPGRYDGLRLLTFTREDILMSAPQTYKNHARFHPAFHFILTPILLINFLFTIVVFFRHLHEHPLLHLWLAVLAFAFLLLAGVARSSALKVQDRVIRLEEHLRYLQLLTPEEIAAARSLTIKQIVALRFASDGELPGLVRRAVAENLTPKAIKESITSWRPDTYRV